MDIKKIIADAEKYHDEMVKALRLGDGLKPTPGELYELADNLYRVAIQALNDRYELFRRDAESTDKNEVA